MTSEKMEVELFGTEDEDGTLRKIGALEEAITAHFISMK